MKLGIEKILCPVDFSKSSAHALRYATSLAEAYGSHLTLFHVIDMPLLGSYQANVSDLASQADVDEVKEAVQARLDKLVEKCEEENCSAVGELAFGNPYVELIKKAKAIDVDLIVMGTHGQTGLRHLIIGSVAEKVVRKAPCPVLTVKLPDTQTEQEEKELNEFYERVTTYEEIAENTELDGGSAEGFTQL